MILGHETVLERLGKAIQIDRIGSTYMFLGKSGIGKSLVARELACGLNCSPPRIPACGQCPSCGKIQSGNHPDVMEVEPEGAVLKIGTIRELCSRLRYRPYEGASKVVIIHDADKMNVQAQNALLKTLEEPPPDTVMVLLVSNLSRMLPTIISRSQLVRFKPLSEPLIERLVTGSHGYSPEEARLLAGLADGSAGKALGLDREFIVDTRREILQQLCELDRPSRMLDFAQAQSRKAPEVEEVLDLVAAFYRDVLHKKLGRGNIINTDLEDLVDRQARDQSLEQILKKFEAIIMTSSRIRQNANKQLALEALTLTLKDVRGANIERT